MSTPKSSHENGNENELPGTVWSSSFSSLTLLGSLSISNGRYRAASPSVAPINSGNESPCSPAWSTPLLQSLSTLTSTGSSTPDGQRTGTPAAGAAAPPAIFTPLPKDAIEWGDFCTDVNVSPPKEISMTLDQVRTKANDILAGSQLLRDSADGSNSFYTWHSLRKQQKACMAFLINEKITDEFPDEQTKNTCIVHCVLGIDGEAEDGIPGKAILKNLDQFVRKGGDLITRPGNQSAQLGANSFAEFLEGHKDLWGEEVAESCTMFSLNPEVKPILRFQAEFSMVCAFVVSAAMIHYRQVIHPQDGVLAPFEDTDAWPSLAETVSGSQGRQTERSRSSARPIVGLLASDTAIETRAGNFTLNIGRYMRHTLTAKEKYDTIFGGAGFVFEDVMNGILKLSNHGCDFLDKVRLSQHPQDIYLSVKRQLQHGALCCRIRLYNEYYEQDTCLKVMGRSFTGDYHFVTILGVARTPRENGGVMFLAQDSYANRPFKNFSLDCLRQMGAAEALVYIPHHAAINMPASSIFDMKAEDIVTAGGLNLMKPESHGSMSEKEPKKKQELLKALLEPDYKPEWYRNLFGSTEQNNVGDGFPHDMAVEGDEGTEVVYQE